MDKEKLLVNKLKNGDHGAFMQLYEEYRLPLYRFAFSSLNSKEESQDLVQIVFLRIWERRNLINLDLNFKSYLYTIAKNQVYTNLRARLYRKIDAKYDKDLISSKEVEFDKIAYNDLSTQFAVLVNELPERRRQIFLMSRMQNKTYRQIAKELNISENTVDTQIRKSLNYFRKKLKNIDLFLVFLTITGI